ncbi:MAG: aconitate hydratase AcnA [Burkholderiales bacterium]|nr:aconitate hydratase AcnA [Burkholderiales bacterium]
MHFKHEETLKTLDVGGKRYDYYSLRAAEALGLAGLSRLPNTLKIILESLLRRGAAAEDINALPGWLVARSSTREIGFTPARVMMVEASGIPLLGDLAAMRDAMVRLGGDPQRINPLQPVDLIVDHSIMADVTARPDAHARNMALEFERNRERYEFLRWSSQAFNNLRLIPPGVGICHQINLEHLAQVVWTGTENGRALAYPDSVLGMDSHTPMINSLGVVGWGVGGLEGGTAALGEPVSLLIPEVVGVRLNAGLRPGVTTTDLALAITQELRRHKLIGKFVEFIGPGVDTLALPERATIANMAPEYGATMGYFAIDAMTLDFLRLTGREEQQIALVEAYARIQGLWRDIMTPLPEYSSFIDIDLATIEPSVAGPRRPHERTRLAETRAVFDSAYPGHGTAITAKSGEHSYQLRDGDVVIAAITSCTNTSNPSVMIGAGLLARNAAARGLRVAPWVKTSLSPGSRVVADYLEKNGLIEPLAALGFDITGYGCMTCMGNSGPLPATLAAVIEEHGLATCAVLSGNRNFEGRIHPAVRANFLASPPLVIAYALAGSMRKNLDTEALGTDRDGNPVFLRDIWPEDAEIQRMIRNTLSPTLFRQRYADIEQGPAEWQGISSPGGANFSWDDNSTFIRRPPFFDDFGAAPPPANDIRGARVLAMFGDMLTTDHISPIGAISVGTPAADYLQSLGIKPADFVNYAARRLNHDVMMRGAFANIRIRNEMTPGMEGSRTLLLPEGEAMSIFDAAQRYRERGVPLVVIAGTEYGAGSSRDWAAKGPRLLGVRAILAESFERIHRSNLVGMGVLPLQFGDGATRRTLGLDGSEEIDVTGLEGELEPRAMLPVHIRKGLKIVHKINVLCRLDTRQEVQYYRHGGILHYVLRQRLHKPQEITR